MSKRRNRKAIANCQFKFDKDSLMRVKGILDEDDTEDKIERELGRFTGYVSIFDNVDFGGDIVRRGAFKKTLEEKKGKLIGLFNHDKNKIIGFAKLEEDEVGLKIVDGRLNLEIEEAKNIYSNIIKGREFGIESPYKFSFGYDIIQASPLVVEGRHYFELTELKLWEWSFVTFPMNDMTHIVDIKSLDGRKKNELREFYEFCVSGRVPYSKEIKQKLITILKSQKVKQTTSERMPVNPKEIKSDDKIDHKEVIQDKQKQQILDSPKPEVDFFAALSEAVNRLKATI